MNTPITYVDGKWTDANAPLWTSMSHGVWLSSFIFDGARTFEGVSPDLELHCQRAVRSALALGLKATTSANEIEELAREGIAKFSSDTALYIRPMFWADEGFIAPDPETTRFGLTINPLAMPDDKGFSAHLSSRRRPMPDAAPTDAKAACLYPNAGRALQEARAKGFDNCVMMDPMGNVAEFATANIFIVSNGVIKTPIPSGSFLNGITRQRVIKLLRDHGETVIECRVLPEDVYKADEIFNTGNYGKVLPVIRYEDHDLQPGPKYRLARDLYWDFAHKSG